METLKRNDWLNAVESIYSCGYFWSAIYSMNELRKCLQLFLKTNPFSVNLPQNACWAN